MTCTRMTLRCDSLVGSSWQAAFAFSAVIMGLKSRVFKIQSQDQEVGVWIIEKYRAETGRASTIFNVEAIVVYLMYHINELYETRLHLNTTQMTTLNLRSSQIERRLPLLSSIVRR